MNTANRAMWIIIGVILTGLGVAGVLVSLGHLPGTDKSVPLVTDAMRNRWLDWGVWAPIVVGAAGLLVAIAGALLIRAEMRRRGGTGLTDVVFHHRDATVAEGRIRVDGATLRRALQRDLQNDPLIRRASVRLTGHPATPRVHLRLDVAAGSDVSTIHESVSRALERFRTTTQLHPTLNETEIRVV